MQSVQQGKLYKLAGRGEFAKAVGVRLTRGLSGILIYAVLIGIGSLLAAISDMIRNPAVLVALVIFGTFAPYICTIGYLTLTRQGFAVREGENVTIKNRLIGVTVPVGSAEVRVLDNVRLRGVEMFKVVQVTAGGKTFKFYTDDVQYFEMLTRKNAARPDDRAELVKARQFQRRKQKYGSAKETAAEGDKYVLPYRHNRRGARAVFILLMLIWCAAVFIVILAMTQDTGGRNTLDIKQAVLVILILSVMLFIAGLPAIAAWRSGRRKYPKYILLDRRQSLISTERCTYEREKITNAELYTDRKRRAVLRFRYDLKKVKLILGSVKEGKWYSFDERKEFADEIEQMIKISVDD